MIMDTHFYQRVALRAPLIKGSNGHSPRRRRRGYGGETLSKNSLREAFRAQKYLLAYAIEAVDSDYEITIDLRGL